MPPGPGDRLGPYQVLEPLGAGGMGEVYRARHTKLDRDVALKVLPAELAGDPAWLSRFEREARTASALNHPNIVTIYDIAEQDGITYIAMELVEGTTLHDLIAAGPLAVDRAVQLAQQIAGGLAKAHAAGIVHRDIKPANVMVTGDGLVKILDFGIAKLQPGAAAPATTLTQEGMVIGTPQYMAPEQHAGEAVDHRADQFAFGVVLYEMLGGKPPFDGPSAGAILSAILLEAPRPLRRLRADVPAPLEQLVQRCLAREPAARWPGMAELAAELRAMQGAGRVRVAALARRPAVIATLLALVLAVGAATVLWARGANRRWAEGPALEEVNRLTETGRLYEAVQTARRAERFSPANPLVRRLIEGLTLTINVVTEPAGAEVALKSYASPDSAWEPLGTTPLPVRLPYALARWRISKPGFETFEGAPYSAAALGMLAQGLHLDSAGSWPAGMVRIPGGTVRELPTLRPTGLPVVTLAGYFLDRYEVTNRQYREFVTAGGYQERRWWPAFERDGDKLAWEEAVPRFTDATGRPGPATWEAGGYAAGGDDLPVGGLSWFEAAAYCAWAGKALPSIYHWFHALGQDQLSDILQHSNIDGAGPAPVGRFQGLAAFGTYDMAGNVKEWAWNAAGSNHYILGAAWNEPAYLFRHLIAQDPWQRDATAGVRCAKFPAPPAPDLLAPVMPRYRYDVPPPLSDAAFAALRGSFAYDDVPLDAQPVSIDDSIPGYRRLVVSVRTAYDAGRMAIIMLLPREVPPPWQPVIWFPGDDAFFRTSSDQLASMYLFDFLPRSGRALIYPVYKGLYERSERWERTPIGTRDMMIRWAQDISRTIDFLGTRREMDTTRIAFYGFSAGAVYGPFFTAVEPRIKTSILLGGGLVLRPFRPESHPAAFAPRSRAATLMINGRDDFIMPYDLAQRPLFDLLGAPADHKRLVRLDGGHIPTRRQDIMREVLDWLDRYLGPVNQPTAR